LNISLAQQIMPDTLQKETIREGNGIDKPMAGDTVTMDYTGWLYEKNQPDNRGKTYGQPKAHSDLG
jgi:FK506-binding protein 1